MERVITCPCCFDDDRCFEDVINDTTSSYICFNCGMTSNSLYTKNSAEWLRLKSILPKLVQKLEFFDESRNLHWHLSILNMGKLGIIYPEGNVDDWKWKFAKIVPIPKKERKHYPIPGEKNKYYDTRLDMENATEYNHYDFFKAIQDMGIVTYL